MTAGSGGPADLDALAEASGQFHYEHCSGVGPGGAWCDCDCAGPTLFEALVAEVKRLREENARWRSVGFGTVDQAENAAYSAMERRYAEASNELDHALFERDAARAAVEDLRRRRALDPGAEPGQQR